MTRSNVRGFLLRVGDVCSVLNVLALAYLFSRKRPARWLCAHRGHDWEPVVEFPWAAFWVARCKRCGRGRARVLG